MQLQFASLFALLAGPVAVMACEGECIVGITDAFLGNYSSPVLSVLYDTAQQISLKLIPPESRTSQPIKYLSPIIDAYNKGAYDALENAIFPSYFHGKCQDKDGVDPPGCPNPDCPVVCGTPGSLVHFYDVLKYIAYNDTSTMLVALTKPGSETYKAVEKAVKADAVKNHQTQTPKRYGIAGVSRCKRAHDFDTELEEIMKEVGPLFKQACGAGLVACSWEAKMKEYILSFP